MQFLISCALFGRKATKAACGTAPITVLALCRRIGALPYSRWRRRHEVSRTGIFVYGFMFKTFIYMGLTRKSE